MSAIKIARAAKIANAAKFPRTWSAIISAIPASVIKACSSKQIAALADAMRAQYEIGHSAGYSDAK
jgi:hypothetical protein